MLYYCEQYHRFLQLQKMTTKVSSLFTNYTTLSLAKKWGLQLYIKIKALDYECILIGFEHMSSER